jgi:hypothetical protein
MLGIDRIDQGRLLQMAHTLGFLRTHQVTLAGMPSDYLAATRNLEALGGAAMGLQF